MLLRTFVQSFLVLVVFAGTIAAQTASSATAGSQPVQAKDPLDNRIDLRLQEALRERDAIIRNLLQRVAELEWRLKGGFTTPPGDLAITKPVSTLASNSINSVVTNAGYDTTERQATEALDQALIVRGGLLLPPGKLEVDNTTSYFSASSEHVTINGFALLPILVVGDIASERVRRDILLPSLTTRLGLPHKFQLDFQVPYGYELLRTVDANNVQTSSSSFGLGDIQAAVTRQLTMEHRRVPDMLANVRYKSTTGKDPFNLESSQLALGTGFNALQGNVTVAKSSDPVVFYGNFSYTANLPGDHTIPANDPANPGATKVGHFRPGDALGFQIGSILALNPETSMTLGWDQLFTRATLLNGTPIPASYLVEGTLRLGTSYVYAPGKIVDLSFGVGLTPDTPNLQFSVGFPLRFQLWTPKPKRLTPLRAAPPPSPH
jgi:hypothetical protein